jgi:hypothetical protein
MWHKTIIITTGLVIGLFSAPLCLDTFQVSDASPLQILLSSAELQLANGAGLGGCGSA